MKNNYDNFDLLHNCGCFAVFDHGKLDRYFETLAASNN